MHLDVIFNFTSYMFLGNTGVGIFIFKSLWVILSQEFHGSPDEKQCSIASVSASETKAGQSGQWIRKGKLRLTWFVQMCLRKNYIRKREFILKIQKNGVRAYCSES